MAKEQQHTFSRNQAFVNVLKWLAGGADFISSGREFRIVERSVEYLYVLTSISYYFSIMTFESLSLLQNFNKPPKYA